MDTTKSGFSNGQQLEHTTGYGLPVRSPHRQIITDRLVQMIERAENLGTSFAVMHVGLNRIKLISNTLGHKIVDQLIADILNRLATVLEADDMVLQTCGAEFTVLLWDIKTEDDVVNAHYKIHEALSKEFSVDGNLLYVSPSIGISIYPTHAHDADGLLMTAGAAMSRVKESDCSYCQLYSEEIGQNNLARLRMERDLRIGIEREEFAVYYQPIVNIRTMQIVGAEALLRWNHPEKGMISPVVFIPIAEETGLISKLGKMVLETASLY